MDTLRERLEDLKELRDLVRSLGRGGGWGPLRRAPVQVMHSPTAAEDRNPPRKQNQPSSVRQRSSPTLRYFIALFLLSHQHWQLAWPAARTEVDDERRKSCVRV